MIQAGGNTLCSVNHKYIKGGETVSSNYIGISVLPTTYKMLSNIFVSRLIP